MIKKAQPLQPVDAPIYGYWQALYLAFYSHRLYVDVAKRWRGIGAIYFILMLAVAVIPLSARFMIDFNHYVNEKLILPFKLIPTLYIQNGEVSFDKPMPYLIKNRTGSVVAIIDTTGRVTKISNDYPQLSILITHDKLYYRAPELQSFFIKDNPKMSDSIQVDLFDKEENEVFVGEKWAETSGILRVKTLLAILIYPCLTVFLFGTIVPLMLALALLGQVFSHVIFKFKLTFKAACRMISVASTAQFIVFFLLLSVNRTNFWMGIFNMALLPIYFSYAVLSVKRESNKLVFA